MEVWRPKVRPRQGAPFLGDPSRLLLDFRPMFDRLILSRTMRVLYAMHETLQGGHLFVDKANEVLQGGQAPWHQYSSPEDGLGTWRIHESHVRICHGSNRHICKAVIALLLMVLEVPSQSWT